MDVNVPDKISLAVASSVLAGGVGDFHPIGRPTGLFVFRVVGDVVSVAPVGVYHDEAGPAKAIAIGHDDPIAAKLGLACLFIKKPLVTAINVGDVKVILAAYLVIGGEKDLASKF